MVVTVLSCEAGGRPGRWPPSRTTQSARHAASAAVGLSGLLLELVFQFCRITDRVGPLLQLAGELVGWKVCLECSMEGGKWWRVFFFLVDFLHLKHLESGTYWERNPVPQAVDWIKRQASLCVCPQTHRCGLPSPAGTPAQVFAVGYEGRSPSGRSLPWAYLLNQFRNAFLWTPVFTVPRPPRPPSSATAERIDTLCWRAGSVLSGRALWSGGGGGGAAGSVLSTTVTSSPVENRRAETERYVLLHRQILLCVLRNTLICVSGLNYYIQSDNRSS